MRIISAPFMEETNKTVNRRWRHKNTLNKTSTFFFIFNETYQAEDDIRGEEEQDSGDIGNNRSNEMISRRQEQEEEEMYPGVSSQKKIKLKAEEAHYKRMETRREVEKKTQQKRTEKGGGTRESETKKNQTHMYQNCQG
jgi:hypothetical protein